MPAGFYVTGGDVRGGGGGGGLPGARPRDYSAASGGVPGVTSPTSTITNNLGDLSSIINSITSSQSGALKNQYPSEYFGILGTLLGNTQRRAGGDISDLLPELQQSSAEAAVAGGVSGSGAENTKLLRDIGLTRYGVENQALKDLGMLQSEIPTVRPFDPSGVIEEQLRAQERADMFAAAPSPEAAYRRALSAAGGSGGGGGSGSGGIRYNIPGGGGGKPYDPMMRGLPPIAPQFGSAMNPSGSSSYAPYGSGGAIPGSYGGGYGTVDDLLENYDQSWLDRQPGGDFGGSLGYGGGGQYDQSLQNFDDFDPWLASLMDVGGGVNFGGNEGFGGSLNYGGGGGFYGGGEDFGLGSGGADDYYDDFLYEQGF